MNIPAYFYTFLVGSHAAGWCLIAHQARNKGCVDLCQFVRAFLFAPFVLFVSVGFLFVSGAVVLQIIIPNIFSILECLSTVFGALTILGLFGYFVVTPGVKKAYGVAKPFSEKICIVLYRSTK